MPASFPTATCWVVEHPVTSRTITAASPATVFMGLLSFPSSLGGARTLAQDLDRAGQDRQDDDREDDEGEVAADDRDVAEQVAAGDEAADPDHRARHVVEGEARVAHPPDAGHERREGPHDGHEARDHDGRRPVALVELVGAVEVL